MAERLLMIEDDATLAQLVREYLSPLGFSVSSAGTAAEGLRRVAADSFDAVLLDVMLPDLDGFEVCRRIRAGSDVPILMLTARGRRRRPNRRARDRGGRLPPEALQPSRAAGAPSRNPAPPSPGRGPVGPSSIRSPRHRPGRDEVAHLASSFNRAADRIERLVESQRRVLVHASHELRSPLARLRLSLEMMPASEAQKDQAARDVAELDSLIEEVLEASRLEARGPSARQEPVDLLALVAEEGARHEVDVRGEALVTAGDPRLLRRLVRNLLENARRHGGEGLIEARVERAEPSGLRLLVLDRGPGVAESERERIFEPFHRPSGSAESGQGFGLGLALVRQIARAHGGEAQCRPREGGGTVFEVLLTGAAG